MCTESGFGSPACLRRLLIHIWTVSDEAATGRRSALFAATINRHSSKPPTRSAFQLLSSGPLYRGPALPRSFIDLLKAIHFEAVVSHTKLPCTIQVKSAHTELDALRCIVSWIVDGHHRTVKAVDPCSVQGQNSHNSRRPCVLSVNTLSLSDRLSAKIEAFIWILRSRCTHKRDIGYYFANSNRCNEPKQGCCDNIVLVEPDADWFSFCKVLQESC